MAVVVDNRPAPNVVATTETARNPTRDPLDVHRIVFGGIANRLDLRPDELKRRRAKERYEANRENPWAKNADAAANGSGAAHNAS